MMCIAIAVGARMKLRPPIFTSSDEQTVISLLTQFRKALSEGSDAVPRLLGAAEKVLQYQQADREALSCKGAAILLLACHGMERGRQATYVQTGLDMVDQVLAMPEADSGDLLWIVGMTLGTLRAEWGRHPQAMALLEKVIAAPEVLPWQRLWALCMLSGLAQLSAAHEIARAHFATASALNRDEALTLYCQFMERRATCEALP